MEKYIEMLMSHDEQMADLAIVAILSKPVTERDEFISKYFMKVLSSNHEMYRLYTYIISLNNFNLFIKDDYCMYRHLYSCWYCELEVLDDPVYNYIIADANKIYL